MFSYLIGITVLPPSSSNTGVRIQAVTTKILKFDENLAESFLTGLIKVMPDAELVCFSSLSSVAPQRDVTLMTDYDSSPFRKEG